MVRPDRCSRSIRSAQSAARAGSVNRGIGRLCRLKGNESQKPTAHPNHPHAERLQANSISDAIDELADNEKYGHLINVEDEYLGDSPEDSRHYGPSGQVLDLDHLMAYGLEGAEISFPCRYYGDELPTEGVLPTEFEHAE